MIVGDGRVYLTEVSGDRFAARTMDDEGFRARRLSRICSSRPISTICIAGRKEVDGVTAGLARAAWARVRRR